ncbi:carbonic anhydrase [Undibacterium flavidum]|uniref:carbonic anhydrase n=1 Tax=Undibacterium flavidum TaxID=2762297 RepID=A0ABR6YGS6_9BURK|nr:carbonic anhydrase family protein [Undibacterium flavidum]MBC3875742.1 carbonic anhydrase family protein [Undibacterium flavidum]
MRTPSLLLAALLIASQALANDPVTKPIKPASAKEEASSPQKEEAKPAKEAPATRESRSAETSRKKEAQAADELAVKIAERLAVLRKEKDETSKPAVRPYVRPYSAPVKKSANLDEKAKKHGSVSDKHWGYEGDEGPLAWGKLNPANTKCDIGDRQSPIDIRDGIRVELDTINFDYKPTQFQVIDNGHTIQVNLNGGNYLNVSGKNFELLQFHFHRPSEERINGKGFEMVAHLVHKDREGKLAVVAILLELGDPHAVVQSVWNNLPLEKSEAVKALKNIDLSQLLPKQHGYFTYMGSLTTPPCSEGVLWLVLKEPVSISAEQAAIFARLYPNNARPLQKSSGRIIKESL